MKVNSSNNQLRSKSRIILVVLLFIFTIHNFSQICCEDTHPAGLELISGDLFFYETTLRSGYIEPQNFQYNSTFYVTNIEEFNRSITIEMNETHYFSPELNTSSIVFENISKYMNHFPMFAPDGFLNESLLVSVAKNITSSLDLYLQYFSIEFTDFLIGDLNLTENGRGVHALYQCTSEPYLTEKEYPLFSHNAYSAITDMIFTYNKHGIRNLVYGNLTMTQISRQYNNETQELGDISNIYEYTILIESTLNEQKSNYSAANHLIEYPKDWAGLIFMGLGACLGISMLISNKNPK